MKKLMVVLISFAISGFLYAQELPKDVEKVYKNAEHLKSKEKLNEAVAAYKEVLRSVDHIASMVSIAEIEMDMRKPPNYRIAYEYLDKAIQVYESGIAAADKKRQKAYLQEKRDELIPKRNKAKSFVDDFDKAKDLKQGGARLMEGND
jgi:tetratricopeptide (TPR) repeat protein